MPHFRIMRSVTFLVSWLALISVSSADALGPVFPPTSFEELVSASTLIAIGRVQSTSKEGEGSEFTRRTTVEVLKVLKGDVTVKEAVIYHKVFYPTVEVSLTKGQTYLLFLYRNQNEAFFRYQRPDWTYWEVVGDQLVNRRAWSENVRRVPLADFLSAISSELHRTAKPVQKELAGIQVGTNLQQASGSSGFKFIRYKNIGDNDGNWTRYYSLSQNRPEHLVTLELYKGRIVDLNVYFLKNCSDCPDKLMRNAELKYGGVPFGHFGDLAFALGRMWSDSNAEVRLESIVFIKANDYPWGEFPAYSISITDKQVLH